MRFTLAALAALLVSAMVVPAMGDSRSFNWAGYAAATDFKAPDPAVEGVAGSWVVPRVAGNATTRSAVWIGVGGFFTRLSPPDIRLVQVGSEQDVNCLGFVPSSCRTEYFLWIMSLPRTTDYLMSIPIPIAPGDRITASLERMDDYQWRVTVVTNAGSANSQSYTTAIGSQPGRLSGEWIVERPQFGGLADLANFRTVTFSNASAKVGGAWRGVGALNTERVVMIDGEGREVGVPSAISGDGFTVCFGKCSDRSHSWERVTALTSRDPKGQEDGVARVGGGPSGPAAVDISRTLLVWRS